MSFVVFGGGMRLRPSLSLGLARSVGWVSDMGLGMVGMRLSLLLRAFELKALWCFGGVGWV